MPALAAAGVLLLACGEPTERGRAGGGDTGPVLARFDGRTISSSDFAAFLDRARSPGYRPGTREEAARLLRGLLRERMLEREARELRFGSGPVARERALEKLVRERAAPVTVSEAELRAYSPERRNRSSTASEDATREETRARILARKRRIRRDALLDRMLERSEVEVDGALLAHFVSAGSRSGSARFPPGHPHSQ